MPVKDRGDRVAREWFLESAASEVRKDLARLTFDRVHDRRVMEQRHASRCTKTRQRRLEFQRFFHRFVNEALDGLFAPRTEHAAAKSPSEALHAGKADSMDFRSLAVEQANSAVNQNAPDVVDRAGFIVVVAEHGDDRNLDPADEFTDELGCFLR
jgi:hypothetical protein